MTEPDTTNDHPTADVDGPVPVGKVLAPLARELAVSAAIEYGACVRPVAVRRIDRQTDAKAVMPIPCGSTRAAVCPSCADKARRLRMHQAREGWHLPAEPVITTKEPTQRQRAALGQLADLADARAYAVDLGDTDAVDRIDTEIDQAEALLRADGIRGGTPRPGEQKSPRRTRSTRRRQDMPDLPRKRVSSRTTGRIYTGSDGKTYQPSTFLTLTLDSYGRVYSDGTPVDPAGYDYRRQARDNIHFPELVDRFVQNLRRAVGWNVQYFAVVEPQKRLAMHVHMAVRGTISRKLLRQVAAATYHQVWWPQHDQRVYELNRLPIWDDVLASYVDSETGAPLRSWDEALSVLDDDPTAKPAHVARLGAQVDVQGVLGGSDQADKCVGYLVKYVTKQIAECFEPETDGQAAHVNRLAEELRYEPCSPTCANWLLYGVQPQGADGGLMPGHCKGKAHKAAFLGYGGRRCLVSRKWSGKNLAEHRAGRRDHVLRVLGAVGAKVDQVTADDPDGTRYRWEPISPNDPNQPDRTELLLRSVAQHRRWREQYQRAKDHANNSATGVAA